MDNFRPNAAALLVRPDGKILIGERIKVKNAWQFPQGGIDKGETAREALMREVKEEVGISPKKYSIVGHREGYTYSYPNGAKKKNRYTGQIQTYFLCQLKDEDPDVDIEQKPREFRDTKWIYPHEFQLNWLPDFKKDVYRQVLLDFFQVEI